VVAGFSREKETGECTLTVDGRLGEWSCTATLQDGRYVPVGPAADGAPPVPAHLRGTLARLRAGGPRSTPDLLKAEGGNRRALLDRLGALEALKLVERSGAGRKNDPLVWTATGAAPVAAVAAPEPEEPAARSNPAYMAYLNGPVWAAKRTRVFARAGGTCEACGQARPVEVHHTEYPAVLGEESLDTLLAVCRPCHRAAHGRGA
jgi:hypothetical protein